MRVWDEVRAAVGAVTRMPMREFPPAVESGALAWWPLVGLVQGGAAAIVAAAAGSVAPGLGGVAGVLALELLGGGRRLRMGVPLAVVLRSGELWAISRLTGVGQVAVLLPLLLGPLLGRWAEVVQCHGGKAPSGVGEGTPIGRAGFREFGTASLTALGVTMTVGRGVGVLIAVVAAIVVLTIRVAVFRRRGGMTPGAVVASGAVVEAVPFVLLALLA